MKVSRERIENEGLKENLSMSDAEVKLSSPKLSLKN